MHMSLKNKKLEKYRNGVRESYVGIHYSAKDLLDERKSNDPRFLAWYSGNTNNNKIEFGMLIFKILLALTYVPSIAMMLLILPYVGVMEIFFQGRYSSDDEFANTSMFLFLFVSAISGFLIYFRTLRYEYSIFIEERVLNVRILSQEELDEIKRKKNEKKPNSKTEKKNKDPEIVKDESKSSGTGFFINSEGYAITNYHVVATSKNINMSIKGKVYKSRVIATDRENDLALLKSDTKNKYYFQISKQDAQRMDDVTAVGFGFGKGISDEVKTTKGVVSALAGLNNNYSHLQIDASLQPGNSGGPVINSEGEVVGVAVAKMDAEVVFNYTGSLPEGISFAIKTSTIKQFLDSNKIHYYTDGQIKNTRSQINELIDKAVLFIN